MAVTRYYAKRECADYTKGTLYIPIQPSLTTFSLTASLLREGTYSTLRMGLYDVLKDVLHAENPRTYTYIHTYSK